MPVSPFLKNWSISPTNMQSIPMINGLLRRWVHLCCFTVFFSFFCFIDGISHFWAKMVKQTLHPLSMANGRLFLQVSVGWKHGDSVDEHTKSHPLLKPYKALTEKVWHQVDNPSTEGLSSWCDRKIVKRGINEPGEVYVCVGERNIPLASEGVTEEHAGYGLEHWEEQRGRSHVPTKREWQTEEDLRPSGKIIWVLLILVILQYLKEYLPLILKFMFLVFFLLILQINGFSPAPMDLHNIILSRELQVCSASF